MKKILFIRILLCLLGIFVFRCVSGLAGEEKIAEGQATIIVKTVSRLAGDPGVITEKNVPLFKTSDGSPLEDISYKGQENASGYQNIQYSQTALTDETRKLNKTAADFFADEQSRRNDLNAKLRAGRITSVDVAKARQDEIKRRQDFSRKQQAKIDEMSCRGVKSQTCDDIRAANKKFLGLF